MRRNAMNPFERIQLNRSHACPRIGRRFHHQAAVVEMSERIHAQSGACDIAGLGFEGGDFGGIDQGTGIH